MRAGQADERMNEWSNEWAICSLPQGQTVSVELGTTRWDSEVESDVNWLHLVGDNDRKPELWFICLTCQNSSFLKKMSSFTEVWVHSEPRPDAMQGHILYIHLNILLIIMSKLTGVISFKST